MKKHPLYIITPCSRPQNVPMMLESLQSLNTYFQWIWLKPETPVKDKHGNQKRNNALVLVPRLRNVWVRFLDDDNLLHPDWAKTAHRTISTSRSDLILFRQVLWNGIPNDVTDPPQIENGKMDTDQMLIRASAIKEAIWPIGIYEADYYFAKQVVDFGGRVQFVNEVASFYNAISKRYADAHKS